MLACREVLDADTATAARALLVSGLAAWGVAQGQCLAELSRLPELVTNSELCPTLATLEKVQGNIMRIARVIGDLEQRQAQAAASDAKPSSKGKDESLNVIFGV